MLLLSDARELIGQICSVRYTDRGGKEYECVSKIYDATYVPLYGGYLVTQTDDIRFDRVLSVCRVEEAEKATPVTATVQERVYEKLAA